MLKNYAIRQIDFFRENTVSNWQRGNKAKAAEFAVKYALYSGGGFSVVEVSAGVQGDKDVVVEVSGVGIGRLFVG